MLLTRSLTPIPVWLCPLLPAALRDPMAMERANLLNMAKLSIKGLIESALSFGRTLDSDYPPLQQFFVVMEHCLKHGLRGTGSKGKRSAVCRLHGRRWPSLSFCQTWFCLKGFRKARAV